MAGGSEFSAGNHHVGRWKTRSGIERRRKGGARSRLANGCGDAPPTGSGGKRRSTRARWDPDLYPTARPVAVAAGHKVPGSVFRAGIAGQEAGEVTAMI